MLGLSATSWGDRFVIPYQSPKHEYDTLDTGYYYRLYHMSHLQTRSARFFGGGSSYLSPSSTKRAQDDAQGHSRIILGFLQSCDEIHVLQVLHGFFGGIPRTEVQDREQGEREVVGDKYFMIPFALEEDVPP